MGSNQHLGLRERKEETPTSTSLADPAVQEGSCVLLQEWKGVGDGKLSSHIWPHSAPAAPLAAITV